MGPRTIGSPKRDERVGAPTGIHALVRSRGASEQTRRQPGWVIDSPMMPVRQSMAGLKSASQIDVMQQRMFSP